MTTTATFLTEFRSSMTFEYKAGVDTTQAGLVSNMLPQHQPHSQMPPNDYKTSDSICEIERSSDIQQSPGSSRGTSLASSPALPIESASINTNGLNQDYNMRDTNMEYPSSDDSVSMQNDMSGYNDDQDDMPSPLAQLQCALEKNGMIGKKIDLPAYPGVDNELLSREHERNGTQLHSLDDNMYDGELYKCHLCSYSSSSKSNFNSHMNSHFDHKCPFCDYTSRTEGRLKRHVKDFHSETPPDSWAGTRVPRNEGSGGELSMDDSVSSTGNNKPRTYRCKQCGFVAYKKNDFWEHNKTHIKAEKLLTCPQCNFVTEYKHHLEYHIRNHFGSKPFKCGKCNYSCVNKSMLNSHMKSHSNIYQYRCSNCSYATKYCHSLKLHLRKYDHKPSSILNVDGTPNPFPVIDVYGTRRGPRPKKRSKFSDVRENGGLKPSSLPLAQSNVNYNTMPAMMPSNLPVLYPPQFFNGYHNNMFVRPPMNGEMYREMHPQGNPHFGSKQSHMKCLLCEFTTDRQDIFHKHMLVHAAKDNQDLIKLYGITSETILQMQEHQMAMNNARSIRENGMYKFEIENRELKYSQQQDLKPQITDTVDHNSHNNLYIAEKSKMHESCESEIKILSQAEPEKNVYKQLQPVNPVVENNFEAQGNGNTVNRSVIVSHKSSSPKPSLMNIEPEATESTNSNEKMSSVPQTMESSPLDLSSAKTNDSRSPSINQKDNEDGSCSSNELTMDTSNSNSEKSPNSSYPQSAQMSMFVGPSRNRRKGKAFKLDRYLQVEDQASPLRPDFNVERMINERSLEEVPKLSVEKQRQLGSSPPDFKSVPTPTATEIIPSDYRDSPKFLMTSTPKSSTYLQPVEKSTREVAAEEIAQESYVFSNSNLPMPQHNRSANSTPQLINSMRSKNNSPISDITPSMPKNDHDFSDASRANSKWRDAYMCTYCDMAFRDCVMYTMHMGYHGYGDPYTCNMCGYESKDKVEFFLHIARAAHT